jgi:hypothetical protein
MSIVVFRPGRGNVNCVFGTLGVSSQLLSSCVCAKKNVIPIPHTDTALRWLSFLLLV